MKSEGASKIYPLIYIPVTDYQDWMWAQGVSVEGVVRTGNAAGFGSYVIKSKHN